jgi:hypothetical protein
MINLSTILPDKNQAIDIVSREGVANIEQRMTADYSRAWLEAVLRWQLQQGLIETLQVIKWADDGDEIADAALRRVYREMRDARLEPSVTLEAYAIKALERGPIGRGDGRNTWFDNCRRDIGIGCLVFWTMHRFGFNTYSRNREQRRRQQPSPSSLVSDALGRRGINVGEKRVENIYARLKRPIEDFWRNQRESPLTPP